MDLRRGGRALADAVSSRCQSPRDFGEEGGRRETRTSCATGVPARENPADPDGAAASPTKKTTASNKGETDRPARRGAERSRAAPQLVDLEARSLPPGQLLDSEPLSSPLKRRRQRPAACESRRVVAMVVELLLLIGQARLH